MILPSDFPRVINAVRNNAIREGIDPATADDIAQEVALRHLEGRLCRTAEAPGQVINTARIIARRAGTYRALLPHADAEAKRASRRRKAEEEGRYRVPVVDRSVMPDPQTIAMAAEPRGIPLADALAAYGIGSRAEHEPGWTPTVTEAGPPEWMPDRIPVGLGDPNPASREASRLEAINDWRRVAGLPPMKGGAA
jgi:hypothetical protein